MIQLTAGWALPTGILSALPGGVKIQRKDAEAQRTQRFFIKLFPPRPLLLRAFALDFLIGKINP